MKTNWGSTAFLFLLGYAVGKGDRASWSRLRNIGGSLLQGLGAITLQRLREVSEDLGVVGETSSGGLPRPDVSAR